MSDDAPRPLAETWAPPVTLEEQFSLGARVRQEVPRSSLAHLETTGRDPMTILDEQDSTRVAELVPIRTERMAANPFSFYRGTAAIMAFDLGRSTSSGLSVASCGDAHVANFGLYASPGRSLVFDLNDFDEAAWAPWEWDVKRLVTSIVIAGQATGRRDKVIRSAASGAIRTYAAALQAGASRSPVKLYYDRYDPATARETLSPEIRRAIDAAMADAEKRTAVRAARRLTRVTEEGRVVFTEAPPTMTHVSAAIEDRLSTFVRAYRHSTNVDIRILLSKFQTSDIARRVVGVGSVGTRCYLVALQDGDENVLLLQAKEANSSVLIQYGRAEQIPEFASYRLAYGDGGRVVALQRILQAVSDPFLGHAMGTPAEGGEDRAFYVRQFHDKKGGFEIEGLEDRGYQWYSEACGATLARAHGQSPTAPTVAGYVGGGRTVGESIIQWAYAYADLSRADWELFRSHRGVDAAG